MKFRGWQYLLLGMLVVVAGAGIYYNFGDGVNLAPSSFVESYGGKVIYGNDGKIQRVFGKGVLVSGFEKIDEGNAEQAAREFLKTNEREFGISEGNLRTKQIVSKERSRLNVLRFEQVYTNGRNEIPVENSDTIIVFDDNHLVKYKTDYKEFENLPGDIVVSKDEAIEMAREYFGIGREVGVESKGKVIYTAETEDFVAWKLVFLDTFANSFALENEKEHEILPIVYVGDDGFHWESSMAQDDLSGTVTGEIYPYFSHSEQVEVPIEHNWIYVQGEQSETDEEGNYLFSDLAGTVNVDADLAGPFVRVENLEQENAHHSASVDLPIVHDFNWYDDDGSYKQAETNVFYHVNLMHDYVTTPELDVGFLDVQETAEVNHPFLCGGAALYTIEKIRFYSEDPAPGNVCENGALDAGVIYHEYGHRVNQRITPDLTSTSGERGTMAEGYSDYWACTILDDPCVFRINDNDPSNPQDVCTGRICNSNDRYPDDYVSWDGHYGAQFISAPFWELREIYGASYADALLVNAADMHMSTFDELVENVLLADDDNYDLSDGTPHIFEICTAFLDNHGLGIDLCLGQTNTPHAEFLSPTDDGIASSGGLYQEGNLIFEGSLITGFVSGTFSEPMDSYVIEYSTISNPLDWMTEGVTVSHEPENRVLGYWNYELIEEGNYYLRLRVNYGGNELISNVIQVYVDNLGTVHFLVPSTGSAYSNFGSSVAIEGNVAIVGAFKDNTYGNYDGAVYIFGFDGIGWNEEQAIYGPSDSYNYFGRDVSIDGDSFVVGSNRGDYDENSNVGVVYYYEFNGNIWEEVATLTASVMEANSDFGTSVDIDGNVIVVGAPGKEVNGNNNAGAVYVFRWNGFLWQEEDILTGSDIDSGDDFGYSVAVEDDLIVVGAPDDDSGYNDGNAYVFRYDEANWIQEARLLNNHGNTNDKMGFSIGIENSVVFVGETQGDKSQSNTGIVNVYEFDGSNWNEVQELEPSDGVGGSDGAGEEFGHDVSAFGDIVLVGSRKMNNNGVTTAGAGYIYKKVGNDWVEIQKLTALNMEQGDMFGWSVATHNDKAIVGAFADDDFGENSGSAYIFEGINQVVPVCGNGILDEAERCDDGNLDDTDGCRNQCQTILFDLNDDGLVTIAGDLPPFSTCIFNDICECPDFGPPPENQGCYYSADANANGFISIAGDLPPFVECVFNDVGCYESGIETAVAPEFDIGGVVHSGDPIDGYEGDRVVLTSVMSGETKLITTNEQGVWRFSDIEDGEYKVEFYCQNPEVQINPKRFSSSDLFLYKKFNVVVSDENNFENQNFETLRGLECVGVDGSEVVEPEIQIGN
jgi:cysteine-rich repeat protein